MYRLVVLSLLVCLSQAVPFNRPNIINGQVAAKGQFPWQAAIILHDSKESWFCSGSVISAEWIVTASHCLIGATNASISLGSPLLGGSDPDRQKVHSVLFVVRDDYNNELANDIGLIKVTHITFNSHVNPISLGNEVVTPNVVFTTSGWGSTSDKSNDLSDKLAYVSLTTISNTDCQLQLKVPIHEGMVCGKSVGGKVQSTCDGDSGGPAVINAGSTNPVLVGIVCFASNRGCESGDPAGFTRVAHYRDWIRKLTGV